MLDKVLICCVLGNCGDAGNISRNEMKCVGSADSRLVGFHNVEASKVTINVKIPQ